MVNDIGTMMKMTSEKPYDQENPPEQQEQQDAGHDIEMNDMTDEEKTEHLPDQPDQPDDAS